MSEGRVHEIIYNEVRTSLFWDVTQRLLVVRYRRIEAAYRSVFNYPGLSLSSFCTSPEFPHVVISLHPLAPTSHNDRIAVLLLFTCHPQANVVLLPTVSSSFLYFLSFTYFCFLILFLPLFSLFSSFLVY